MSSVRDRWLFAACVAAYLAVATRLTDGLTRTQFDNDAFADFFEAQAEALLRGDLALETDAIGLEAFVVDGRDQMYFGLFPALLRVPILAVTDAWNGQLTLLSSFAAWVVFVVSVWALTDHALDSADASGTASRFGVWSVVVWKVTIALGTPMFTLAGPVWVFSEAIMWGVATCAFFQYRLVRELAAPSSANQWWVAGALVLAVLNRPTLGLGCLAVTIAVVAWRAVRARRLDASTYRLGAAAGVAAAVFVTPNLARFGRVLGPPMELQRLSQVDPRRMQMLDYAGGDFADVRYVPTNLLAYLRPDGVSVSSRFPFIDTPERLPTLIGGVIHDITYRTPSIVASSPLLVALAVAGVVAGVAAAVAAARRRRSPEPIVVHLGVAAAAGAPAVATLFVWGFIAPRYLADFVPLLVPLAIAGLLALITRTPPGRPRRALGAVVVATAAWSIAASTTLALSASYQTGYDGDIAEFVRLQGRDARGADAVRFTHVDEFRFTLDDPPDPGLIAVLGDCEAIYVSTGEQVDPWLELAMGDNDFHRVFDVTLGEEPTVVELATFSTAVPLDPAIADTFTLSLVVEPDADPEVRLDLTDRFGTVEYPLDAAPGDEFRLAVTSDPVRRVMTFAVDGRAVHYGHIFTRSLYGDAGQVVWFTDDTVDGGTTVGVVPVAPAC